MVKGSSGHAGRDGLHSSKALQRFQGRSNKLWHFYWITNGLLEVRSTAASRLRRRSGRVAKESHEDWLAKSLEAWELGSGLGIGSPDFRGYFRILEELYVVRQVDYFNMFLAELFLEIADRRPQILASEDKVEVSLLIESESLRDVKALIANRKAIEISHGGLSKIIQYFRDGLKLRVELEGGDIRRVKELIAIRNLLVHHDGLITERFLIETKWPKGRIGQRIEVFDDLLEQHHRSSDVVAAKLSEAAASKFGL